MPKGQVADGVSLVPLINGTVANLNLNGKPRSIYWHFPAYLDSYRGITNEQQDPLFRSRPVSVIRKGKWKLMQFFESGDKELYDLESDIAESTNVATSNTQVVSELFADLASWQSKTKAAIPVALNPEFDAAAEKAAVENPKMQKRTRNKK